MQHNQGDSGSRAAEAIAKAYKLIPAALRILLAIAEIGGAPEVAETLGIADGTVKTHLGHLFREDRGQT